MISRLFPTEKNDPELSPFRSGLVFGFFNALTWQIGIGTPMVLFAEALGASPLQVGLAYSFVFLLTPIQILSTALLPKHGFKKVMLGGWGMRSVFLSVPIVLAVLAPQLGPRGWMVHALVGSVFLFCFFRSIGAAAIIPWLYSILPVDARGRYFANDQFISGIGGVATLLASAALFGLLPTYPALLVQYTIALFGSTLSYFALKRLPDAPNPTSIDFRVVFRDTPRHMFTPSPFRHYLWLAVWYTVLSTSIPPFAAYYLKVGPGLSAGQIMLFEVLRYSGVIVAAWAIRRRIDVTGARPFFLLSLVLYAFVAAYWWLYLQRGAEGVTGVFLVYFLLGLGAACWTIANLNYLPKVTSAADRTLMVSIQGAITACIGGFAPIIWGLFLKSGTAEEPAINVPVFQWLFVSVLVSAVVLSSLIARLPEDKKTPVEPLIIGNAVLRPFRAATYLVNLIDLQNLTRARPPGPPPGAASPPPSPDAATGRPSSTSSRPPA
ncbi:MAG TPA: MFS transporter [Opitutaceae bacterium]